jgi:NAD(P)-dependent dehydrogenase (short-subunit alcohol dehydrogenase family)
MRLCKLACPLFAAAGVLDNRRLTWTMGHHSANRRAIGMFTYQTDVTAMIVGVGLMGQHMATHILEWLRLKKLVLVDHQATIRVGTQPVDLAAFAESLLTPNPYGANVVAETVDITSEESVQALFERHHGIAYLQHTAGISPRPLTPPERLTRHDVLNACEVNLWGAHNVIKQGVNTGAFVDRARGVLLLSTSATVGSEGRASSAYEESKGALMNLLRLQSRHFMEQYGLILNGLAPSPLRGPMAAQNEVSAGRLQAVADNMPLGDLTQPKHVSAATMYFWANECWCLGEVLTIDGGYTKHRPIYGPLG